MEINGKEFGDIFLAPMAGVSDVGFRTVCRMAGADLSYTEMVSAMALCYNSEKTKELLITHEIEEPKAVQIFGHDPRCMSRVCTMQELEKFDIIDLNFGCPAPKIVKNGDGSALLKNLNLVAKIVSECKKATSKPITCKFRIGFEEGSNVALDMARICEESGASAITVHGRTREQMYSGAVDYDAIATVKQKSHIKVIGNGDVVDLASYNRMKQTGVDAVMIGRGALGNPNIFAGIKGTSGIDKLWAIKKHVEILRSHFDERFVSATMRKHLLWYIAGEKDSAKIKLQVATNPSLDESIKIATEFIILNRGY